jgi:hypothetical protein
MKARCVEHDVELIGPNANGDSYCPSCALGWFEKSGGRSHQALAKAMATLLQDRLTSRAECSKHGEVDLTRPDDAGNSYCPACIIEGVSGEVLAKYAARVPSSSSPNIQNAADAFKRVRELEEENAKLRRDRLRLKEALAVCTSGSSYADVLTGVDTAVPVCSQCRDTGALFFSGAERISPDGEGTASCCAIERCDKCRIYDSDEAAMTDVSIRWYG